MDDKPKKIIKKDQHDQDISLASRLDLKDFTESSAASDKKVVSREDLIAKTVASEIVKKAQAEAGGIKQNAKAIYLQVEDKMREAKEKGFAQGRQEGLASVTQELLTIKKNQRQLLAELEKNALGLIYEIAQKIIGDNLQTSEAALMGMIRQALQSALGNQLVLYIHPQDMERIKSQNADLLNALQTSQSLNIKSSENVKPLGCVIESELGTIDAQLEYQLSAIKKALDLEG